jgi:hypothetical protein
VAQHAGRQSHVRGASETTQLTEMRQLLKHWQAVTYELAGPKQKQRVGYFDPALITDPRAWLERPVGRLVDQP